MQDDLRLMQARLAHQSGALGLAEAHYRDVLARHPDAAGVLQDLAGVLHAQGRHAEAGTLLDRAVALCPGDAGMRFNRGLVAQAAGDREGALADFDAAIAIEPTLLAARLNRGAIRYGRGDALGALEDFQAMREAAPGAIEGHYNAGLALLRLGRGEDALAALEVARRLAPGQPAVVRACGNALREAGRPEDAVQRLREALALDPASPVTRCDLGMALLASGEPAPAIEAFTRALAQDPTDQAALAGLYLASNELGRDEDAARLCSPRLCDRGRLALDATEAAGLREAVLAHPALRWEPSGKTTRRGEQTAFLDLSAGSAFAPLAGRVAAALEGRIQALGADPGLSGHPWLRGRPARWRLQMWATVLHEDGHQAPHIHPAGWMSGVFYLDDGGAGPDEGGTIHFGTGPADLRLSAPPQAWSHQPASGDLLLFPSYLHHHTAPFRGPGVRISLAFDLVPA